MSSAARWTRRIRPLFTLYVPVMPFVLFALFPLYFMVVTSFKKNAELYDVNAVPFLIGRGVTFGHYELLSKETLFWSWFLNSLMVSLAATVISVVLGVLAAYPLARLKFPRRDLVRRGHLRHVSGTAIASVPAAQHGGGAARPVRQPLGAGGHLSDVSRPLLHLAPHGVLPHGAGRRSRSAPCSTGATGSRRC